MLESAWGECGGCGKVCWRVGKVRDVGRGMGGVGEGKGRCESVKKCGGRCGRVYGVCVGGERYGGCGVK